ncbi:terminase, partial [Corynebacterium sp.]|uniref:terminase n=1 Tax=Corynebacterium sp. TaxID=1720 RepID=UPI0028A8AACC
LYPWQEWVLIHGLELLPDGSFRFKVIVIEVARQNGKTLLMVVLGLWRLYVYGAQRILSSAQSLIEAKDTLDRAFLLAAWDPILRAWLPDNPRVKEDEDTYNGAYRPRVNGEQAIKLNSSPVPSSLDIAKELPTWSLAVTSRKGGRSKSVDLGLLDELREHLDWEAWNGIVPTSRARPNSQMWAFSNAGDARSVVLASLRMSELNRAVDGITSTKTAYFSYSAHPEAELTDPEAHAQANPSMGYGEITEESVMAEAIDAINAGNEAGFRAEVLCQWPNTVTPGKIPMRLWNSLLDVDSHRAPGAEVFVGIDVSNEGKYAHIAICSQREDGLWHVEVVASRAGFRWVPGWLAARRDSEWFTGKVGMQVKGSASATLTPLLAEMGIDVVEWQGTAMSGSVLGFVDEVQNTMIRHRGQPILDVSIEGAIDRKRGDIYIWDRANSGTDASPTVATNIAWWMATRTDDDQFVSAYADEHYNDDLDEESTEQSDDQHEEDDDYILFV